MTSTTPDLRPYGTGDAPQRPPITGAGHAWRAALTAVVAVVGGCLALAAAFVSWVLWTDCFLSCGGNPDPLSAAAVALGGLLALLAAPVLARLLWRRWSAAAVTAGTQLGAGALLAVSFFSGSA